MCMTGESVLCMNISIHPQGTISHLSPTAEVCQGAERDPPSLARQSNTTKKQIENNRSKQFLKDS